MWASILHMDPMWNLLILLGPYMNQPVTPSCFTKNLFLNLPIGVRLWWRRWYWSTVPWAFWFSEHMGLVQESIQDQCVPRSPKTIQQDKFSPKTIFVGYLIIQNWSLLFQLSCTSRGMVYLYLHFVDFYGIKHVSKDTGPIDPMG